MRLRHCLIIAISFTLAQNSLLLADEGKSGKFYDDNFAITPLDKEKSASKVAGSTKPPVKQSPPMKTVKPADGKNQNTVKAGVDTPSSKGSLEGFDVQPIISIGLIVDGFDQNHCSTYLAKMVDLLEQRKLNAGHLYVKHLVSTYSDLQSFKKLEIFGAVSHQINQLPEKYAMIERSPTWIVQTEKGEYLLEGVESPQQFITGDGGFVEKPIAAPEMEEAKPTSTPLQPAIF